MLYFIIAGYFVLFTVLMILAVKLAPLGYEDETGFHYKAKK